MSSLITLQRESSQCKDTQATREPHRAVTKSMGKRAGSHWTPSESPGVSDSSTMDPLTAWVTNVFWGRGNQARRANEAPSSSRPIAPLKSPTRPQPQNINLFQPISGAGEGAKPVSFWIPEPPNVCKNRLPREEHGKRERWTTKDCLVSGAVIHVSLASLTVRWDTESTQDSWALPCILN